MSKHLEPLLDPRGYQERPMLELAKRPTLEELKRGKILFYNNTKLGFCNYYTVFDRICGRSSATRLTGWNIPRRSGGRTPTS